jgi:hypothetical protein
MTKISSFDAEVLKEFDFLVQNGFRVSEVDPTIVRFLSDLYFIYVFWGPRTREVGMEIGSTTAAPLESASSIGVLISVFDWEAGVRSPMAPPALTEEDMKGRVHSLATDFRRYVDINAFKSPDLRGKLLANGIKIFRLRYPSTSNEELNARFYMMWENKQYAALHNLFGGPFRKFLSDDQRQKLEMAEAEIGKRRD